MWPAATPPAEEPVASAPVLTLVPAAPPATVNPPSYFLGTPAVADFPGYRWVLFDAEGQAVKGLHGMASCELEEIKSWPGPKWDRNARSWR